MKDVYKKLRSLLNRHELKKNEDCFRYQVRIAFSGKISDVYEDSLDIKGFLSNFLTDLRSHPSIGGLKVDSEREIIFYPLLSLTSEGPVLEIQFVLGNVAGSRAVEELIEHYESMNPGKVADYSLFEIVDRQFIFDRILEDFDNKDLDMMESGLVLLPFTLRRPDARELGFDREEQCADICDPGNSLDTTPVP